MSLLSNFFVQSFIDNVIKDTVIPVKGSVVYCGLFGYAEHSGIYIGDNKIVHLDGSGIIEVVSPQQFIERLSGLNPAMSIYVSCNDSSATGTNTIAKRAKKMVGKNRKYHVILDNCHQFTSGCITGNFDNADNFLWMLKSTAGNKLSTNKWRVWERKYSS